MRSAVAHIALSATIALLIVGTMSACSPSKASESPPASIGPSGIPAGRLAYRLFLDGAQSSGAVFVSNSDGSHQKQLTKPAAKEVDTDPDWSPDGSKIVFGRYQALGTPNEVHQIAIMNSDGTGLVNLTAGVPAENNVIPGFDDSPVFSPDGRHIAFSHANGSVVNDQLENSALWVMNTDGSDARPVITLPPYTGDVGGFAWSPDGSQILYGVGTSPKGTPPSSRTFFLINADGTGNHQLGSDWASGEDGNPSWSGSTNKIVFRVDRDVESGVGNFFTINPDGTGLTQVTQYSNKVMSHKVSFSPDGKWIVYSIADVNGLNHLVISAIDGSRKLELHPKDLGSSAPDWGPAA